MDEHATTQTNLQNFVGNNKKTSIYILMVTPLINVPSLSLKNCLSKVFLAIIATHKLQLSFFNDDNNKIHFNTPVIVNSCMMITRCNYFAFSSILSSMDFAFNFTPPTSQNGPRLKQKYSNYHVLVTKSDFSHVTHVTLVAAEVINYKISYTQQQREILP